MRYFKNNGNDDILARLDASETNVSSGTEITETEYKCMRVGINVFINNIPASEMTASDWGADGESDTK